MHINKIIRPSIGARFIAPIADSSALGGRSDILRNLLMCIIAPYHNAARGLLTVAMWVNCRPQAEYPVDMFSLLWYKEEHEDI